MHYKQDFGTCRDMHGLNAFFKPQLIAQTIKLLTTQIVPMGNNTNSKIRKPEKKATNKNYDKESLKQLMVSGYLRQMNITSSSIIPSDLVLLIISFTQNQNEYLTKYFISMSMRENVFIQIGQCGIQIGNRFWKTLRKDHNLNQNGKFFIDDSENLNSSLMTDKLDKIDAYFQETAEMRFVPRGIQIDLEPNLEDIVKTSSSNKLLKDDNFCTGASGAGNNWYYSFQLLSSLYILLYYMFLYSGQKDIIQKVKN